MAKEKTKQDRRKSPRANTNVVIRYHILEEQDNFDLSQTKNLGQGGILLTTNRYFNPGTHLAMTVFFPFLHKELEIIGEVVDSRVVVEGLIYETHVRFQDLDEQVQKQLALYVDDEIS